MARQEARLWIIGSSKTEEDDETEDQDESEDEQETAVDNELSIGCSIKHLKSHGVMLLSQRVWRLSK